MKPRVLGIAPLSVLLLLALLAAAPSQPLAEPSSAEQIKALAARLDALERVVLRDPLHPSRPVMARLDVLEQRVTAMEKGVASKRQLDQIESALKTRQNEHSDLARRLKELEAPARQPPRDLPSGRDVQDLQRQVNELTKTANELKRRLQRLESTR